MSEAKCRLYEYSIACNPTMTHIPVKTFSSQMYNKDATHIYALDLSHELGLKYKATSPNLLASFVKIRSNDSVDCSANASSQMFYVIQGCGQCRIDDDPPFIFSSGDAIAISKCSSLMFHSTQDTLLYWVTDEPLMQYLGVHPSIKKFDPIIIKRETMATKISEIANSENAKDKNRLGVLLGNQYTEDSTMTLTPILWSLLNIIPANTYQKPHKHNSVALDLCVYSPGCQVYTLMGPELDENGRVKNPIRCDWVTGSAFTTPPGWWHSHHNDSFEPAWVLPVQDAGLHTYLRTLDIQFSL